MERKWSRVWRRLTDLFGVSRKPAGVDDQLHRVQLGMEAAKDTEQEEVVAAVASQALNGHVLTIEGWTLSQERAAKTNAKKIPERRKLWAELQAEVDRILAINPTLSKNEVCKRVADKFGCTPRTVSDNCNFPTTLESR